MKRCPSCDALYTEEDVFCELDGSRLTPSAPTVPASPVAVRAAIAVESVRRISTSPPAGHCASCNTRDSDDGEGYCKVCGARLDQRLTVSILPQGATVGGCVVVGQRGADDVVATSEGGVEVALAVGPSDIVANEVAATRALTGHPSAPALVATGEDPRRGPFLVLAALPDDAVLLADAAPGLPLHEAMALAREVLAITVALERAELRWVPRQTDFHLARGRLFLSRVRGARLEHGRADACCPTAIFGRSLLPAPGLGGTPTLFRILSGHGLDAPHALRDADQLRAELETAALELARPPGEGRHLASLCDGGLKRDHNEDAVAVATGETRGEPWTVLVVCDGVSSSTHAEQASAVAAKTACDALAHFARSGDIAYEAATAAMHAAIRAAHVAVCSAQIGVPGKEPPGTTIVAGLVYRRRLTVGWVGDSRAYWVGLGGGELLTRDHSWAQETVAAGAYTEEEAMQQPLAHALTRCLGPLEGGDGDDGFPTVQPDVRARDLPGPGHVVLCSDGLWNYFPDARAIAELVASAGPGATTPAIARRLVTNALYRGGGDNVSVAVYRHDETR